MFFVFGNFDLRSGNFQAFRRIFWQVWWICIVRGQKHVLRKKCFPKKKRYKKVSDIRQINSTPFLVCNFYVSVPLSWDKQRFQKVPSSSNLLRRAEIFGVLAFHFRQVYQNTIPRVSTRVLRRDFVLAEVFYSDSLSGFEQNVSGNCLKTSQNACQSCLFLIRNYILRT